ncbi:hypothetical protein [Bradyrhizobium glycinis]|uniref:hypothetical protein n=1 Tax=Bradyrhizobium glycinis TaxID=2751812 RepID=UPI0035DC901A
MALIGRLASRHQQSMLCGGRVLLDENVEWALYGLVHMFSVSRQPAGQACCAGSYPQHRGIVQVQRFEREMTILGLDSAASILRSSLLSRDSKTTVALRLGQFAQFQAARLIKMRALVDT